jgi:hypothetical protein
MAQRRARAFALLAATLSFSGETGGSWRGLASLGTIMRTSPSSPNWLRRRPLFQTEVRLASCWAIARSAALSTQPEEPWAVPTRACDGAGDLREAAIFNAA